MSHSHTRLLNTQAVLYYQLSDTVTGQFHSVVVMLCLMETDGISLFGSRSPLFWMGTAL